MSPQVQIRWTGIGVTKFYDNRNTKKRIIAYKSVLEGVFDQSVPGHALEVPISGKTPSRLKRVNAKTLFLSHSWSKCLEGGTLTLLPR